MLLALGRASEDAGFYGDSVLAYDEYLHLHPDEDTVRRDRARVCGLIAHRQQEGCRELEQYISEASSGSDRTITISLS